MSFDDFVSAGGEHKAKEAGKWRLEGRITSSVMAM